MGRIAAEQGDHVIVTSDNPRSEPPRAIIDEITPGVEAGAAGRPLTFEIEPDRRRAIGLAVGAAAPGDLVLIAGKGHESYQEVAGVRHAFDDRQIVREALRASRATAGARDPGRLETGGTGAS